jgi:N-acetylglucosamine-6-phosphate deacetylase
MATALVQGRVLLPHGFQEGLAVVLDGGRISAVMAEANLPAGIDRHDLAGATLVPGFIDTQVNGGGDVLFNDAPTVTGIAAIGAAHRRFGTTGFLPTLISDDLAVIREAIAAVDAAIEAGIPGVLGIHIEGPFLNRDRRGIHLPEKIRTLDAEGLAVLTSLKRGRTLVTLAPERTTPEAIAQLIAGGVIVAAGHSDASYEQAVAGIRAGISGVTHLFNAMSPLTSRAPGLVGAALEQAGMTCGIIVDGHHVSPATLRVALRTKPRDGFMLVTDAMPSVGSDRSFFMLQGRRIEVRDGMCTDEAGTLAGSNLDMAAAVRNAAAMLGVPLEDAIAMASRSPAGFLRLGDILGEIAPGYRADLVALDAGGQVIATWIDGTPQVAQAAPVLA